MTGAASGDTNPASLMMELVEEGGRLPLSLCSLIKSNHKAAGKRSKKTPGATRSPLGDSRVLLDVGLRGLCGVSAGFVPQALP